MSPTLPDTLSRWLAAGEVVVLATQGAQGSLQQSVLWATIDGDDVLMSTVEGRVKHTNLLRDPHANVLCYPRSDPYSYVEVRGRVQMTTEGGRELIDHLCEVYTGERPFNSDAPGTVRVVLRLHPDHVAVR